MTDAISEVGHRLKLICDPDEQKDGGHEAIVDVVDDLLSKGNLDKYTEDNRQQEGRLTGYLNTLKLIRSIACVSSTN